MLIPLAVLALGALVRRRRVPALVHRRRLRRTSGAARCSSARTTTSCERDGARSRRWCRCRRPLLMALGLRRSRIYIYIVDKTAPGAARRDAIPALYRFLLNKWYFDELYDFLFVRPAFWLGRLFWKGGDGAIIDGLGPDGVSARVLDVTARRRAAADRLPLSLRLRDAARRCRASRPGICSGGCADVRLLDPLERCLSCRWSARRSSCCCRGDSRGDASTTRAGSRC